MSIELENSQIESMRQRVTDWLSFRPTLKHTPESLALVLNRETWELTQAAMEGRPQDEVSEEVGDVLFSLLAQPQLDPAFKTFFMAISQYCQLAGTTVDDLFDQTELKNDINYPIYFFQRTSPYINSSDAIDCLRVLRKYEQRPQLLARWVEIEARLDQLPFFDGYEVTQIFREQIHSALLDIKGHVQKSDESGKIDHLLKVGRWDGIPLQIDLTPPQNHLILL